MLSALRTLCSPVSPLVIPATRGSASACSLLRYRHPHFSLRENLDCPLALPVHGGLVSVPFRSSLAAAAPHTWERRRHHTTGTGTLHAPSARAGLDLSDTSEPPWEQMIVSGSGVADIPPPASRPHLL